MKHKHLDNKPKYDKNTIPTIYSMNSILLNEIENSYGKDIGEKLDDFEILKLVSKREFLCFKVKSKLNNKIYTMYKHDFNILISETEKKLYENTPNIAKKANNPHIVKYYHSFIDNDALYLIEEYIDNGDLESYIKSFMETKKAIPEDIVISLLYQSISALLYCHRNSIIHRDVKPAKLFINEKKVVKLGDFSISMIKQEGVQNTLLIGTPQYMAPEMFSGKGYDSKIDIYALGCSFHILCYFSLPRKIYNLDDINGKYGTIDDIPIENFKNLDYYSKEIKDLIYRMIERDHTKRPNSEEVYNYVKELYNKRNEKNNYDFISCAYNCLYSFKNLTGYIEKQKSVPNKNTSEKPVLNSFIYYLSNLSNTDQEIIYKNLYANLGFIGTGEIEPIEIIKFIIEGIHSETYTGNNNNINIFGDSLEMYNENLLKVKSMINDLFFGTIKIEKLCENCNNIQTFFTNFYQLTFNINEALAIGIGRDNPLLDYFMYQNKMITNYNSFCSYCHKENNFQEKKMIYSLPKNLILFFQGEKYNHNNNNRYMSYPFYLLHLNFEYLDLDNNSPKEYDLKAMIKCINEKGKKYYICIYLDHRTNQWFLDSGKTKKVLDSPTTHEEGNIIALFYDSDITSKK